jgi:hypothetical protein
MQKKSSKATASHFITTIFSVKTGSLESKTIIRTIARKGFIFITAGRRPAENGHIPATA